MSAITTYFPCRDSTSTETKLLNKQGPVNKFGFKEVSFYLANPNSACNHFHNILRLFDVLPNFPFTKSETMRDY